MNLRSIALCALTASVPISLPAQAAPYSYLEAGWQHRDPNILDSGNGAAIAGSLALGESWHLFAGYARSDHDIADLSDTRAGLGYRLSLSDSWDALARVSYEDADFDELGDGDGYGVEVAFRGDLADSVDLELGVRYRDLDVRSRVVCIAIFPPPPPCAFIDDQDGDETSGFLRAHWRLNNSFGVVAALSAGDKANNAFIGPRWSF